MGLDPPAALRMSAAVPVREYLHEMLAERSGQPHRTHLRVASHAYRRRFCGAAAITDLRDAGTKYLDAHAMTAEPAGDLYFPDPRVFSHLKRAAVRTAILLAWPEPV